MYKIGKLNFEFYFTNSQFKVVNISKKIFIIPTSLIKHFIFIFNTLMIFIEVWFAMQHTNFKLTSSDRQNVGYIKTFIIHEL